MPAFELRKGLAHFGEGKGLVDDRANLPFVHPSPNLRELLAIRMHEEVLEARSRMCGCLCALTRHQTQRSPHEPGEPLLGECTVRQASDADDDAARLEHLEGAQ